MGSAARMADRLADLGDSRFDMIVVGGGITGCGIAREAVERSGYRVADIAMLCPIHTKRSLFAQVLAGLDLREDQAVYLSDHGHMSALDPLVALHRARAEGRLADGSLVVLLAAGTGYSWAATAIRWGRA